MTGRTCSFAKLFIFKSDTPIADRDVILNVYLHEVLENIEIGVNCCLIVVYFTDFK